jgi:hypothetical protein
MNTQKSYEYRNEFLYFIIRPDESRGTDVWLYCSGVNASRFSPITRGRHGIGSNPATRGLQSANLGVRALALSRGAKPRALRGKECAGLAPIKDMWYTDRLLIEHAPDSFPDELITYAVTRLLTNIFKASLLEVQLPDNLLNPDELQLFLETVCRNYGR